MQAQNARIAVGLVRKVREADTRRRVSLNPWAGEISALSSPETGPKSAANGPDIPKPDGMGKARYPGPPIRPRKQNFQPKLQKAEEKPSRSTERHSRRHRHHHRNYCRHYRCRICAGRGWYDPARTNPTNCRGRFPSSSCRCPIPCCCTLKNTDAHFQQNPKENLPRAQDGPRLFDRVSQAKEPPMVVIMC